MRKPFLQPQNSASISNNDALTSRNILSVGQVNRKAKSLLEQQIGTIWIEGEVSNFIKAASGHWYFTLKDQSAQIKCALFKFKNSRLNFLPKEGDKVVVKGKISLYEARGDYQLIGDYMEPSGLGDLQRQLNELIKKLQSQGLFETGIKKPIPIYPKTIGVVTSPTGAAIHDVLTVLKRRSPMIPIIIYPTQVQGADATTQIINAIKTAESRKECDVLLITRGGGSLEDLWCFNDEQLAKQIDHCSIPIVAAVGHEVDTTITELVADLRAATPSAAAELLSQEQESLFQKVDQLSIQLNHLLTNKINANQHQLKISSLKLKAPQEILQRYVFQLQNIKSCLIQELTKKFETSNQRLSKIKHRLEKQDPSVKLFQNKQLLKSLKKQILERINANLLENKNRLSNLANQLNLLSPLSTLGRGYSIVKDSKSNRILNKTDEFKDKQLVSLLVSDGSVDARIERS